MSKLWWLRASNGISVVLRSKYVLDEIYTVIGMSWVYLNSIGLPSLIRFRFLFSRKRLQTMQWHRKHNCTCSHRWPEQWVMSSLKFHSVVDVNIKISQDLDLPLENLQVSFKDLLRLKGLWYCRTSSFIRDFLQRGCNG